MSRSRTGAKSSTSPQTAPPDGRRHPISIIALGETAVLSVIAAEVARRGLCRLTIGHIAVLAGVSRSTVKTAVRQAQALGILTSEEWRLTAWRSALNTVRIVSPEWRTWLRMRDRKRAEADQPRDAETSSGTLGQSNLVARRGGGVRSSTTLRITDSCSNGRIERKAYRQEVRKGGGGRWSN